MAINIQEILHPSDSDAIKFEKINYNFDQIVANGGGPTGQKGNQGLQGAQGNTGAKGQKGDVGPEGPTGATTSPWQKITVNSNSNTATYSILKPKLTTDNLHPTVFLGDQIFNENTPHDGLINLRATLTIGKHAQGTLNGQQDSDELLRFWHGADNQANDVSIDMSSANQSDGSVRYTFGKSFDLDPSVVVEYYAAFDKFTIDDSTSFKVPSNSTLSAAAGLIRYNPSTNVFQGGISDGQNITWVDFCMSPCGQGGGANYSIAISPEGDVNVNQYGTPYEGSVPNAVSFTPTDDYTFDNSGNVWTGATTSTTTSTTTAAPAGFTLTFPNGDNNATVAQAGGTLSIDYLASDDAANDYTLTAEPTSNQAWAQVDAYFDTVDLLISANSTYSSRTATITLVHPEDSNVTATITITQSGLAATTQAPATTSTTSTTTQAPTTQAPTTQAPTTQPSYTITYNRNGGSGTMSSTSGTLPLTVKTNTYTPPSGKSFVEWNTGYTGGGTSYAQGATYNTASNVTLYAIWDWSYEGSIVYNANGGTGSIAATTYNSGSGTITISNGSGMSRSGYTLTGWSRVPSGSFSLGQSVNVSTLSGGVETVYAQWTANATTTTTGAPAQTGLYIDGYEDFIDSFVTETFTANLTNVSSPTYSWSTNGSCFSINGSTLGSSVEVWYECTADCGSPDSGSVSVTVNGLNSNGVAVTLSDTLTLTGCVEDFGSPSDVELKENIELVGKSQTGYNIYNWNWKDPEKYGHGTYQGVLAQEMPIEVVGQRDGYLTVNYKSIDVEFKKIKD